MVMRHVKWMLRRDLSQTFRFWLISASGLGLAAALLLALWGMVHANDNLAGASLRSIQSAEESCFDLKAATLAYTAGPPAPQWALTITYTHQDGLDQPQSIMPIVTMLVDDRPLPLSVLSRWSRPADGQYDVYVDVQHRKLFEPASADEASRLANAVGTLWQQLKHVALDAAMSSDTKPAFSCNCVCPDVHEVKIQPGKPIASPDPGSEPAAVFQDIFTCVRLGISSGKSFQQWQVGYEKPAWRIVIVGQVEFLDKLAESNSSPDDLADWLHARYQTLIASYSGKVLIFLFDPRNVSDRPIISDARLSLIAETLQKKLSEPQAGKPKILIADYRDEAIADELAPPIETVLTVGLPKLFSRTMLNRSSFDVTAPPCSISVPLAGTDVETIYTDTDSGDLVDLWKELILFFLVFVTAVGSWTLLLSTIAYRQDWFGIRGKLETAFIFPWIKPLQKSPDGASSNAEDN